MTAHCEVPGTPSAEHQRSLVAKRTARLAAQSQLVVAHFEHRAVLPWPEALCPAGLRELADSPTWERGQLREHKFQSFRHDRMTGSFHPGHRAKWTAHELCHTLVGFAYHPGATRYFHALAAWLAELLPVAVYYFFDEAGLNRCAAHAQGGALYGSFCPACERAALAPPRARTTADEAFIRQGLSYMDAELAAFARARRTGLPRGHRHATLDLCSDGVGYAAAHGLRLDSAAFERFASEFFGADQGLHADLDALEDRVLQVRDALLHDTPLKAWRAAREDWIAQDLGYRLLLVHAQTEGEAERELDRVTQRLAASRDAAAIARAAAEYRAMCEEWLLPDADQVLALGIAHAGGSGSCLAQLAAGIESACPNTFAALDDAPGTVASFAAADAPERSPLGVRFARFLACQGHTPLSDLARYEAALSHAPAPDPCATGLDVVDPARQACRLSDAATLLELTHDVLDCDDPSMAERRQTPLWLVLGATAERELAVAEVDPELAALLAAGDVPAGTADAALTELAELGLLRPDHYEA